MSYRNGSVWPHDNALIALGFARYGLTRANRELFKGVYDARRIHGPSPLPGTDLWAPAPARPWPDALPGGLRSAGLVGRDPVRALAGMPRPRVRSVQPTKLD